MRKPLTLFMLLLFIAPCAFPQKIFPYKNPGLPINVRVNDLLQRMTPEEKFWQLFMIPGDLGKAESIYSNGIFGFQVSTASSGTGVDEQVLSYNGNRENALLLAKKINSIQHYFIERTRLGIPMIAFDESLHGLVRSGATSFPQAIGLAASFDTGLMKRVATAIAVETKSRGIRQVLTPVINIASDVRWGRTEETYGEDPFLSSAMGVAFITPFENAGIIATPKHFIANVGDGGRDSYPIHYNERLLEEIYLPPFKNAIRYGGARSVMTAYNSLDGSPSGANNWLLNKKLKKEWGFKGFVISDASAVGGANVLHYTAKDYADAGKRSITAGLDVIFQTAYEHHKLFIPPFLNGEISKQKIDDAVRRVLTAKFDLGLFEHPYVSEEEAARWVNNSQHKALAKEAALKSIVLLKNEKGVLPISKKANAIAVIGMDATEARLGGYSGPGNNKVSILDGITQKINAQTKINYARGVPRIEKLWNVISAEHLSYANGNRKIQGLKGEYFTTVIPDAVPTVTRTDNQVDFNWTLYPPDPALQADNYSVRWTGQLTSPQTGKYKIGLDGNDGYRLYINNVLLIDNWQKRTYQSQLVEYIFEKDRSYDIRIEFYETAGNAHIHFVWNMDVKDDTEQRIDEAVEAAKRSEVAVIVAGIEEGEFRDRASLALPGQQEKLIESVVAVGKPVVVVLVGGSAITMQNWIGKVNGIIDVWYPGEEGGPAVADVLFGDYNPAARLPISFPLSEAQLPLVYNHKPTGRGDDYNNLSGLPLFPFGYGLSYTSFLYSDLVLDKKSINKNQSAKASFTITNTGNRDGEEVAQLYIRDVLSSVARPVLELKGFQRIFLKAGEKRNVVFDITPDLLMMLNEEMKTVVEPGIFRIMIGASSRDLWLKGNLEVK
jgi:beta-glucosidase